MGRGRQRIKRRLLVRDWTRQLGASGHGTREILGLVLELWSYGARSDGVSEVNRPLLVRRNVRKCTGLLAPWLDRPWPALACPGLS